MDREQFMISQSFEAFAVVWERLRLQAQPVSPTVPGRLKLSICQKRVRGLREYLEGGNVSHHSPEAHVQELEQANRPSSCLDLATSRVQMLLPATVPHPVLPFLLNSKRSDIAPCRRDCEEQRHIVKKPAFTSLWHQPKPRLPSEPPRIEVS